MSWVAVAADGREAEFEEKPKRTQTFGGYWYTEGEYFNFVDGHIETLIGRKLTWDDEPVEL